MSKPLPPIPTEAWTSLDTVEYLTHNPLPVTFTAPHRDGGLKPVLPKYAINGGYGKWLRETPYFQGLFEEIHEILVHIDVLPTPDELADRLMRARERRNNQLPLL